MTSRVPRPLSGRVVVVTGVTAGIGRHIATALLDRGAHVVGCARDSERLDVVAGKLPGLVPVPCDVRDADDRARLVRTARERFGRIDALVNNAGLGFVGSVLDMTSDDVERLVSTNLAGLIDLTRMVLPEMVERGDGDVLMVSSASVWVPVPPLTVYSATKHGVDGFVMALRRELGGRGIRVHSVNPYFVRTEFLARALHKQPAEDDPTVQMSPGISPETVARIVVEELEGGRGGTVGAPRIVKLGRLVSVVPLGALLDVAVRAVAPRLDRIGRRIAVERAGVRSNGQVVSGRQREQAAPWQ